MNPGKKTVLITGASDGIGLALSKKLLAEGYYVIGTSRSGTIDQINNTDFAAVQLDVTHALSIADAHARIKKDYKRIDILINNAGIGNDLGKPDPDNESFQQTFNTNVIGLVFFAEPLLSLLADGGQVINISSQLGSFGLGHHANSTAYRMSKAALNMYTRTLAERLLKRNIKVLSVHPGWVETKLSTKGAPLSPEASAIGIFKILIQDIPTSTFWNAETGMEMPW